MKHITVLNAVSAGLIAAAILLLGFGSLFRTEPAFGSVQETQEYQATTTYALSTAHRVLKPAPGALAQVTITGDNTGLITIYNATTSNASLRAASKATSTIIIADFPASTPEGTYTFDAAFSDGLLVVTSGAPATSTITWR